MAGHDPHQVPAGEHGIVRVFTTDLEPEGDAAISAKNVQKVLGQGIVLDPRQVEVFPSRVIEGIGLAHYLAEGYDIPEERLAGKAAALDALSGLTIIIRSAAFGGKSATLDPNPALRFVGAFREAQSERPGPAPKSEAAEGGLAATPGHAGPEIFWRMLRSWAIALGALLVAAALVLVAVF